MQALQRAVGNRAVSQLLRRHAARPTGLSHRVLQRNGKSAKVMEDLSEPQVFALKAGTRKKQDDVVAALEKQLSQLSQDKQADYDVSFLGGIELTEPLTNDVRLDDLIKDAELVDLPERGTLKAIPTSSFPLAKGAGVDKKIVETTLRTMAAAGQLKYLRVSRLIDDDWKVVIEVHYYRSRNPKQQGFHKDTAGRTLFVNLNYLNESEMAGPEYVMNPQMPEGYEEHLATRLPKVFAEDLKKAKAKHGDPTYIEASVIPIKGVVSFVDEALHHKTPTLEHRTVNIGTLHFILRQSRRDELEDAQQALTQYNFRATKLTFRSFLTLPETKKYAAIWYEIVTFTDRRDRTQLAKFKPAITDAEIDAAVESGGLVNFGSAKFDFLRSMGFTGRVPAEGVDVKKAGKAPLKRRISEQLLLGEQLKPATSGTGRRTFFRTWIYAIPKTKKKKTTKKKAKGDSS